MRQADREPMVDYEDALRHLVFRKAEAKASIEQMDLAIKIVADVFWKSDWEVSRDLEREFSKIDASFAPRRRRGRFASGMLWGGA